MATFPGAVPSYTTADPTKTLDQDNHTQRHNDVQGDLTAIATKLGTGSSTATSNTVLRGNGSGTTVFGKVVATTDITGTLPVANGGTGVTASTGTGSTVLSTSPSLVTPKVDTINESTVGNGTTVGGVNIKSGALNTNNSVVTANITDNAVTASKLATNAIVLGYVASIVNFTTTSTTAVQLTGLTLSVMIPSGGRRTVLTAYMGNPYNDTNNDGYELTLWDGTVGSGTQLGIATHEKNTPVGAHAVICMAVVQPSAGSKTYNVGLRAVTGGAVNTQGSATTPVWFMVEYK